MSLARPGRFGRSLSYRAAVARSGGKTWGCILCRFLHHAVERRHCDLMFVDRPTAWLAVARAGFWYGVLVCGILAIGRWL